jgi:hypothetical protein
VVAIRRRGKKRKEVNALEEYRRRFDLTGDREDLRKLPPPPDRGATKRPQRFDTAKLGHRFDARGHHRQDVRVKRKARSHGGSGLFFGAAWALLNLALLRSLPGVAGVRPRWNGVAAVIAGCALALAGAYLYSKMKPGSDDAIRIDHAAEPSERSTEKTENMRGGRKLTYARLTPDGPAPESTAVPSAQANLPKPPNASPDNRTEGVVPKGMQARNAPASPPAASADIQAANKPTMVRSETYLPDGTRIDAAPPAPIPSVVRLRTVKPQPPFLAAAQPPEAAAVPKAVEKKPEPPFLVAAQPAEAAAVPAAAEKKPEPPFLAAAQPAEIAAVPAAPEKESTPAAAPEPVPSLETGYFAQVKADQDQKAADAELAAISEKYKAVLGEVPLKTRAADLKEKGVWIRVLAGPLKSRDDAANLCKKLKNAGIEACIVQKIE